MPAGKRRLRIPRHVGVIPDGNRRWAAKHGLRPEAGYEAGLAPALAAYAECRRLGIKEVSLYGFTRENTHRPPSQVRSFQKAVVEAVGILKGLDASLLVVGDTSSRLFPKELLPYTRRTRFNGGGLKVNILVNYSWAWDLAGGNRPPRAAARGNLGSIGSRDVSRIDLVVRWGGRRRLSGFLPVQSAYADIHVLDALWPDFSTAHVREALRWYSDQDITLGG